MWSYMAVADGVLLLLMLLGIVVGAFLTELGGPATRWWADRCGFTDSGQSPAVRRCGVRLASGRRSERMRALELLDQLDDPSAAPALLLALRRYERDAPLAERIVRLLARFGDERALPELRRLSSGRNASLMLAARAAVEAIEPRAVLLRGAPASTSLLRPAHGGHSREEESRLARPVRG